MRIVVVMGRGGQGRVVLDACVAAGFDVVGVLDDGAAPGSDCNGVPVLGSVEAWPSVQPDAGFVLALGSGERIDLAAKLRAAGRELPPVVHPRAWVSPSATIGAGSVLMSGVSVNANARIESVVIVNANASIDHDCVLETGAQIGPGTTFPGSVRVGARAFVGAGVIALPGVAIGEGAIVGAGAVVTRPVAPGTTVAGNPARVRA